MMRPALIMFAAAAPSLAFSQTLNFSPHVYLKTGQSAVVNGARSPQCGAPAPDWATVQAWLPPTDLGTYADAGVRNKFSDSCRADVKVRAVRFTARKAGTQQFRMFGDQLTISVQ